MCEQSFTVKVRCVQGLPVHHTRVTVCVCTAHGGSQGGWTNTTDDNRCVCALICTRSRKCVHPHATHTEQIAAKHTSRHTQEQGRISVQAHEQAHQNKASTRTQHTPQQTTGRTKPANTKENTQMQGSEPEQKNLQEIDDVASHTHFHDQ